VLPAARHDVRFDVTLYVPRQLGHSVAVLLRVYAHLIAEYEETPAIEAEAEISKARRETCSVLVRSAAS
jgi:hypothetical protein